MTDGILGLRLDVKVLRVTEHPSPSPIAEITMRRHSFSSNMASRSCKALKQHQDV